MNIDHDQLNSHLVSERLNRRIGITRAFKKRHCAHEFGLTSS